MICGAFTLALLVALAAVPSASEADAPAARAALAAGTGDAGGAGASDVAGLLARSARAWNHGDLTTFMRSYEDAPDTVYVSATSVIRGYAAIRAHYAAHYGRSGMGELSFSDLTVRQLGADHAVAVARWHLALPNGAHPTGLFSLVLHRSAGGWHIVVDHSP
jgi:ketosteroid isomerase-like protein